MMRCVFTGRWNPLPYSYNVRRKLFYPMKGTNHRNLTITITITITENNKCKKIMEYTWNKAE